MCTRILLFSSLRSLSSLVSSQVCLFCLHYSSCDPDCCRLFIIVWYPCHPWTYSPKLCNLSYLILHTRGRTSFLLPLVTLKHFGYTNPDCHSYVVEVSLQLPLLSSFTEVSLFHYYLGGPLISRNPPPFVYAVAMSMSYCILCIPLWKTPDPNLRLRIITIRCQ